MVTRTNDRPVARNNDMWCSGVAGQVTVGREDLAVPAGHDVTINCSSQTTTYWTFLKANSSTKPRLICYQGLSLSEHRLKYRCERALNEDQWSVVISEFGRSDVGLYTCWDNLQHIRQSVQLLTLACTLVFTVTVSLAFDRWHHCSGRSSVTLWHPSYWSARRKWTLDRQSQCFVVRFAHIL